MKIIKYLLVILIVLTNIIYTKEIYSQENFNEYYELYCPKEPYNLSNSVNRGFQLITGINFLASRVAQKLIKENIMSIAAGDINVKVNSFSATDSKNGKFKSISVNGENIDVYSVYISNLSVKTRCKFMYFDLDSNPIKLLEPTIVDFDAKFSENDLNKILRTNSYKKYFFRMKYNSKDLKGLEISRPRVIIRDEKINFLVNVKAPFIKTFMLRATSSLEIVNNSFNLKDLRLGTYTHNIPIAGANYLINLLNPLNFAQHSFEKEGFKILLKNVRINGNDVVTSGSVFIKKS